MTPEELEVSNSMEAKCAAESSPNTASMSKDIPNHNNASAGESLTGSGLDHGNETFEVASHTPKQPSNTSTLRYGQEPFEQFKDKVLSLCQTLFPGYSDQDFLITKEVGGSFNRIIAINIKKPTPTTNKTHPWLGKLKELPRRLLRLFKVTKVEQVGSSTKEYILRIPRDTYPDSDDDNDDAESSDEANEEPPFDYDAAVLRFVDGMTQFSVPRIVHFDKTPENPIGRPYVLVDRIPGKSLENLWAELNQSQRLSIARECATFITQMTQYTYPSPGKLDPESVPRDDSGPISSSRPVKILQWEYRHGEDTINLGQFAQSMPVNEFLKDRFFRWKAFKKSLNAFDIIPWKNLEMVVDKLHNQTSDKLFGLESEYYFCHGDFYPRNIMAKIVDDKTATITGVLDWDQAEFAPKVIAFETPSWLWRFDEYMDESPEGLEWPKLHTKEWNSSDDKAALEIKLEFEKGISEEIMCFNDCPEVDICRWLWVFGLYGVSSNEYIEFTKEIVSEMGLDTVEDGSDESDGDGDEGDEEEGEYNAEGPVDEEGGEKEKGVIC